MHNRLLLIFSLNTIFKIILFSFIFLFFIVGSIYINTKVVYNTNKLYNDYIISNNPDILIFYSNGSLYKTIGLMPSTLQVDMFKYFGYIVLLNKNITIDLGTETNNISILIPFIVPYFPGERSTPVGAGNVIVVTRDYNVALPARANITISCNGDYVVIPVKIVKMNYRDLPEHDKRILDFINYRDKFYVIINIFSINKFLLKPELLKCTANDVIVVGDLKDSVSSDRVYPLKSYLLFFHEMGYDRRTMDMIAWREPYWNALLLYSELRFVYILSLILEIIVSILLFFIVIKIYRKYVWPEIDKKTRLLESLGIRPSSIELLLTTIIIMLSIVYYQLAERALNLAVENFSQFEIKLSAFYLILSSILGVLVFVYVLYRVIRRV